MGSSKLALNVAACRRATALPLTAGDIAQLALAAAVRNVGMTQLLTEVVTTAIKKGMIEEILREPAQERDPPFQKPRSRADGPPEFRVVHPTKAAVSTAPSYLHSEDTPTALTRMAGCHRPWSGLRVPRP